MSGVDHSDNAILLRSNNSNSSSLDRDLECQISSARSRKSIKDIWNKAERAFSDIRLSTKRRSPRAHWPKRDHASPVRRSGGDDEILGDGASSEWASLLIGCLLGLATGLCVAAFNRA
ncbi:hypothetical protein HanPI659440_Chr09g0316911 [Helianthus annuus]|nr:hypothetical protein HanPI659440_Chr09g0316911 [Helianthus annuus]